MNEDFDCISFLCKEENGFYKSIFFLEEAENGFNDLIFFSDKAKILRETNPEILTDFIEEIYNYIPNHMREKFHRLAIMTVFILGAGKNSGKESDYIRVSRESIDEVRKSPQDLNFKKIREFDPHFADLLELSKRMVISYTQALNEKQPERHKIDGKDMWDVIEKAAKAYWIEIKKAKRIIEQD